MRLQRRRSLDRSGSAARLKLSRETTA